MSRRAVLQTLLAAVIDRGDWHCLFEALELGCTRLRQLVGARYALERLGGDEDLAGARECPIRAATLTPRPV